MATDPRDEWEPTDPETIAAVEKRAWHESSFGWFYWPWNALIHRIELRHESEHPAWDAEHYADWDHESLVWRIRFLQGGWRRAEIRFGVVVFWLWPVAIFVSVILGVFIGRRLP